MDAHPSTSRARSALLLLLLATVPAAIVPFVAFTGIYVPVEMLEGSFRGFTLLAAPFLLGVPLVLWQFRRCFARPSAPWERWLVYALATVSAVTTLSFIATLVFDASIHGGHFGLPVPILCAVFLGWLLRNAPAEEIPFAALALAYLANVALPLLVFCQDRAVGWWLTLVVAAGLVAQLALIVRRTRAARRLVAEPSTVRGSSPAGSTSAST